MTDAVAAPTSTFAPLRQKLFAVLWIATVVGNTGTFIRDVASAWLVTDLSPEPSVVAAVQAATTLPIFLLSIPAGVISDIVDRRKFLIAIQFILAGASFGLLVLSALEMQSIGSLIALSFIGGVGAALMGPAWQAIVPSLVDQPNARGAIALNSLGINVSRAIGPSLGGVFLAYFGAAFTYGVDVISYVFVIVALIWWRPVPQKKDQLAESFVGAFRAGLRYAGASRELKIVLVRAAVYFAFASAIWALMPLIARNILQGTADFYGLLLGAVGAGAVAGAIYLPRLHSAVDSNGLMLASALVTAAIMALISVGPPKWLAVCLLVVMGAGWIFALVTLNVVAQAVMPNWVRGRSLALYLTVFNGGMAIGSLFWGAVAQIMGIETTLIVAAAGLGVVGTLFHRLKMPEGDKDLMPSNHWPEPLTAHNLAHDRGPVMVTIEYRIHGTDREAFGLAIRALAPERRRDGAYAWGVSEDAADPETVMEWFLVESWAEHLRQHQRVSRTAEALQAQVRQYHAGASPPLVRHFLDLP